MRIRPLAVAALLAAGCTGSKEDPGPPFESVAETNGVWNLTGTYAFLCDGSPVSTTITSAPVHLWNGAFDANVIWPAPVCSVGYVHFIGLVNADGSISGTAALPNGALSDSVSGSCTTTACDGETVNTTEFSFSMTRISDNPWDGDGWGLSVSCGGGGAVGASNVTLIGGQYTTPTTSPRVCTDGSAIILTPNTVSGTFSVAVTRDGALTASLTQGTAQTLTITGAMPSLTSFASFSDGSVNLGGAQMNLLRNDPD